MFCYFFYAFYSTVYHMLLYYFSDSFLLSSSVNEFHVRRHVSFTSITPHRSFFPVIDYVNWWSIDG